IEECDRVVIEGCSFSRGAHDTFLVWPDRTNSRVVIRGNVFHPNTCRALLIDAVDRVLFEDNIIVRSNDGGRSGSSRFAFDTKDSIFRHNRIYANWGSNLLLAGFFRDTLDFKRIRFYGNVFDDNTAMATNLRGATEMIENCIFANNAFSRNDKYGEDRQVLVQSGTSEDLVFTSNLIHGKVQFEDKVLSPGEAEEVSDGVFIDNMNTDPEYRDAAAHDYRPAPGSPLIDGGRTFTRTTETGNGSALPVEDSRWFYDGFGIDGERGDAVVVGRERHYARIESINHEQSILYLDRELTWEAGAQVSLPFSGDAPDIGAYETGEDARRSVQILADPVQVAPGETMQLEAVMHGNIKPQAIHWILGDGTVAEGQSVTHIYDQPYDYPVRVAVTDTEGNRKWGTSFVLVEEPRSENAPLQHNTFGESDEDAWWQWMCYRPMPQAHEYLDEGPADNGSLHVYAREDGYQLGAQTQPAHWDLDRYPDVMIRYKISPGTPLVLRLFAFATSEGSRGIRLTQTESAGLSDARLPLLVDDGEWHEITFSAADLLRDRFGNDVKMGKVMYLRASDTDLVEEGDEYFLDEVIIGSLQ
ncbi:MAG: PKD domain-containing protein, partial [Armatimonadota bacterium]